MPRSDRLTVLLFRPTIPCAERAPAAGRVGLVREGLAPLPIAAAPSRGRVAQRRPKRCHRPRVVVWQRSVVRGCRRVIRTSHRRHSAELSQTSRAGPWSQPREWLVFLRGHRVLRHRGRTDRAPDQQDLARALPAHVRCRSGPWQLGHALQALPIAGPVHADGGAHTSLGGAGGRAGAVRPQVDEGRHLR